MAFKLNWISASFDKDKPDEVIDVDNLRMEPAIDEVQRMNYSCTKEKIMTKDWLKEYAPKIPSELVLQKPKLDQLNAWLQIATKRVGMAPILLITGPPGVGKSTALKVLAAVQHIQLTEWETPVDIDNAELAGSGHLIQSQASRFEAFLLNSGRYVSLLDNGKGMKKLILVKEFPNVFTLHPTQLFDILRRYHVMGRVPIVFSLQEQTEGSRGIFPKQFLEELNIQQISFNKVPNKSIMKALKRICTLNKTFSAPSADILEKIVECVHGDIRNAVLQLSYELVQDKHGTIKQHNSHSVRHASHKQKSKIIKPSTVGRQNSVKMSKKQSSGNKSSKEFEAGGKDRQLPIFQRVGRLLYPKKSQDVAFLTHNPEEIVDQTLAHPGRLLHMVLENYLKVFRDMNDSCRAIHYASDADTMMSEFRERELTLPMALSTLARGFMTCKSTASRKWTPLTNQEYFTVRQRTRAVREQIISTNPKYVLMPRDATMDILPIIYGGLSSRLDSHPCEDELCDTSDDEADMVLLAEGSKNLQHCLSTVIDAASGIQVAPKEVVTAEKSDADNIKGEECMTGTPYEIQESESDDESKISEELPKAWLDNDIEFINNVHHF
ncbi:hypothetical protein Cfor_08413 [Coptotermes formosanus]|uniref:AAA+ ATPase domain-containing protein n=1 Tax=Coptotermes formosanus TaxID=36987 RepID=A0A6L2Q4X2_COPFO|nr:hypothetical protein Cfor_08413 [Coptotermes formosanus]